MGEFVDWDLAAATAGALGPTGPKITADEARAVVAHLRQLTEEAAGHVTAFTGLAADPGAGVRVVDRRDWAAANIAGLRTVLTPLLERMASGNIPAGLEAVGAKFTGVQAGTVLAYLSGKVLGQYEVFAARAQDGPGQLLLVAPNIVGVERKLGADPRDFRLWVCLHEVTHRVQFTAVPWLRDYFLGEVRAFVAAAETDGPALLERARKALGALADAVRSGTPENRAGLIEVVQTPQQRVVLDRLTALMTLLEGHAEVVMDGVGPTVIPSVARIREQFNRRRENTNPIETVLRRLLGVDAKMRQYAEGRRFVQAVVDRVGMQAFNRVWTSPETLPTLAELTEPRRWIDRVGTA